MTTTLKRPTHREDVEPINPSTWSQAFGYDQGQLRADARVVLTIAGQGPVDAEGRLLHAEDPAAQLALSLENVLEVVTRAGLRPTDLAQLRIYVTDIDAILGVYDALVDRLAEDGARPPATLVEVTRLAVPGMTVEIDALAVATTTHTNANTKEN